MGLFISFYFFAIILGILFYYLVSTYSVKISAFLIDFIIVGFSVREVSTDLNLSKSKLHRMVKN